MPATVCVPSRCRNTRASDGRIIAHTGERSGTGVTVSSAHIFRGTCKGGMMGVFIGLGLFLLALFGVHHWLLAREVPPPPQEVMDADIYSVGGGWIIRRHVQQPEATVIVMHGFLESPLYFTRYYQDPRIELIMIS